jgi:uncharacterized membrane protein
MNPMTRLVVASLVFLLTHYVSSTPLRARLVALLGKNGYIVLYSAIAFATLGAMVWAYYRAPYIGLWHVPALRYAPLLLMPVALVLVVAGVFTRNPTAVGAERALRQDNAVQGVLRVTRHPVMWGIALWALVHVAARGDAAALVFFGTLLMLAMSGTLLIDRRKKEEAGADWQRFVQETSNVPFAAIVAGRTHFSAGEIGWSRLAIALLLYFTLLWVHSALFGARPY